ncbi:proline--tRNA ligase [Helicobacter sp. 23-1044]
MKFSTLFAPTTKEEPKDCVLKSHSILIRGGFIKQIGSGIYSFLPLGKIVLDKVQKIVKDEMDKAGANEVRLGFVTPAELWEKSKRFDKYGKELLVFRDRKDNRFVLGPTHEEAVVDCAKGLVKSYKQLPLNLYQIHTKFRDEIRPRFGLMRAREFVMKDGYSFHADSADLDREFALMEQTYRRIFDRLGVKYRVVEADSGAIGGSGSKEFMLLADSGEDDIVICKKCDYASNIEAATRKPRPAPKSSAPQADFAKFHTPNVTTIKALSEFFKIDEYWTMKCVAKKAVFGRNSDNLSLGMRFRTCENFGDFADTKSSLNPQNFHKYKSHTANTSIVDSANESKNAESSTQNSVRAEVSLDNFVGFQARNCEIELEVHRAVECAESSDYAKEINAQEAPCFFFIRGCDELNLTKALNAIPNAIDLVDLPKDELESLGLKSGFIGAYGLQHITKSPYIYFDNELTDGANLICGANEADYHFVGVDLATFSDLQYADLVEVKKGDFCPKCGAKGIDSTLDITKGIELGHIFKLGTRYSEPMDATFLDSNGRAKPFVMGCYGIGVSRILPAILEQKADSKGAIWGALAPFSLTIIISNTKNAGEVDFATKIYDALCDRFGTAEILLDDRDERFGVKMADFELLGVRFALIVGKELQNGKVELVNRADLSRKALDSRDFSALVEQINAALSAD